MTTDRYRTFIIRSPFGGKPHTVAEADHAHELVAEQWMRDKLWAYASCSLHSHTALGNQLEWDPENQQYEPITQTWTLYRPHDPITWEKLT